MKKTISIVIAIVLIATLFTACTQQPASTAVEEPAAAPAVEEPAAAAPAEEEPTAEEPAAAPADETDSGGQKTIGFIIAGPDHYYQTNYDVFERASRENEGWETLFLNSEWSFEKELSNVEDLIQKKVDAIVLQTNNAEGVLEACKKSLDAGIPFFVIAGSTVPADITPTCTVEGNWSVAGVNAATVLKDQFPDGCKLALITGVPGQTVDGGIRAGLDETNEALDAKIEIVYDQPGDWQRDKAMNAMQDLIASKIEFDALFVYNEDMADGCLQIMKEANITKPMVSCNGKDLGQAMLKNGDLIATTEFAPTKEGYLMYLAVKAVFDGKTLEPNIPNAGVYLTPENVAEAIPWDVNEFFDNYLNKMWDPIAEIAPYIS